MVLPLMESIWMLLWLLMLNTVTFCSPGTPKCLQNKNPHFPSCSMVQRYHRVLRNTGTGTSILFFNDKKSKRSKKNNINQGFSCLMMEGSGAGSAPVTSVADPGCLSRIPDPDFYPSRIPDPGSRIPDLGSRIQKQQQKRGVKKN